MENPFLTLSDIGSSESISSQQGSVAQMKAFGGSRVPLGRTPSTYAVLSPQAQARGRGVAWKEGIRHRADHFRSYWGGKAISLGFGQPDLGLSCAFNPLCDLRQVNFPL